MKSAASGLRLGKMEHGRCNGLGLAIQATTTHHQPPTAIISLATNKKELVGIEDQEGDKVNHAIARREGESGVKAQSGGEVK